MAVRMTMVYITLTFILYMCFAKKLFEHRQAEAAENESSISSLTSASGFTNLSKFVPSTAYISMSAGYVVEMVFLIYVNSVASLFAE